MFDMILEIREGRDQIFLELTYARDLFASDLMAVWAESLASIVRMVCADPDTPLKQFPWPSGRIEPEIKPAGMEETPNVPKSASDGNRVGDDMGVKALITAWQSVLGVSTAGPEDDFFELGGDSITAMRLEAELFKAGWYLPATAIYELARLGELMQMIESAEIFDDEEDEFV
jgi:aryl carrier-like protein